MSRLHRQLYNAYLLLLIILFLKTRILPSNTFHFLMGT